MATLTTVRVTEGSALVTSQPTAQSMVIDNYSASYLYCSEAGVYVPPMFGRIIGLPSPLSSVTLMWQTPPGVPVPTPGNPPGYATCIFSNQQADTSMATSLTENVNITNASIPIAGTVDATITNASIPVTGALDITSGDITIVGGQSGNVNISTDSPPISIGSITIPGGARGAQITVPLQNNWTGIVVDLTVLGRALATPTVAVTIFDSSGDVIQAVDIGFPSNPAGTSTQVITPVVVPITGNIDGGIGSVTVGVTGPLPVGAPSLVAYVGALLATGVQWVAAPALQPMNSTLSGAAQQITSRGQVQENNLNVNGIFFSWQQPPGGSNPATYIRGFSAHFNPAAATASSSIRVQLKGHTSGATMTICAFLQLAATGGPVTISRQYTDDPINLWLCFPNDAQVDVVYFIAGGAGGGYIDLVMEATT